MKLKKLLLTLPLLFSLASCGEEPSLVGTYSFQLGASDSTHVGITFDLTDEPYESVLVSDAKKYTLSFDIGGDVFGALSTAASLIEETGEDQGEDGDPVTISGYYTVGDYDSDGNRVLNLGVELLGEELTIPPSIMEKIMYATIAGDEINVVIPVSLEDLQYQLYWYGYRVSDISDIMSPVNLMEEDPAFFGALYASGNGIGTYPNDTQVGLIKTYQQERKTKASDYREAEDIFLSFHKHHTITMGFIK